MAIRVDQLKAIPLFSDLAHVPQVEVVAGPAAILLVNLPFPFGLGDESLEVPIARPDSQPLLPRTDCLSHIAPLKIRLSQEPVYLPLFRIEIPGPPQALYSPISLPQAEERHAQPHVKPRLLIVEVDRRLILSGRVPKCPFLKEGSCHVAVRMGQIPADHRVRRRKGQGLLKLGNRLPIPPLRAQVDPPLVMRRKILRSQESCRVYNNN